MISRFYDRQFLACIVTFFAMPGAVLQAADFHADPASVQHYGTGYRYPQSGWTVIHVEGDPYERGLQHGHLLAPEIAGFIWALACDGGVAAAENTWRMKRSFVNAMFARRFSEEQLQEMQGIADGASAAGAKFIGNPVDLLDIICINTAAEMESIDIALTATPTGLEQLRPAAVVPQPQVPRQHRRGEHCCAFAANGPATRDGKIVFGHITTDDLRPSCYFNIWLEFYHQYLGKIDADAARIAVTTPAITTAHAVDAVYTTTDLGLQLASWGHFGPPSGSTRMPSFAERTRFPEIRPLAPNPWTILRSIKPAAEDLAAEPPADLPDPNNGIYPALAESTPEPAHPELWRGTLLPAADCDIWLTNSFALYRGLASREKFLFIMLDKYRTTACGNGDPFTALTFNKDLAHTMIFYGTLDDAKANREGAFLLQQSLCHAGDNISAPVKADTEATEEDLSSHHLILFGSPSTNALSKRFRAQIPVSFGEHSFTIRDLPYAPPESSVIVAAENPLNRRYSMVTFAGLGARAMIDFARKLDEDNLSQAPLILLPAGQHEHNMVLCPAEFIRAIPATAK